MAASGGHWATLAEAQKLSQSTKIPGVFEEDIKRNNPIERVPVAQAAGTGLKIEWLREDSVIDEAVAEKDKSSVWVSLFTESVNGKEFGWHGKYIMYKVVDKNHSDNYC